MIDRNLMKLMSKKPLFLLRLVDTKLYHREYLPTDLQLFITDNNDLQDMWKPQLLILNYRSKFECKVLYSSNLPSFTSYSCVSAKLAEEILYYQSEKILVSLQQFPILCSNEMVSPVSATYDQTLINGLELLPSLDIPVHTRHLANLLGVCIEINLKSCLTVYRRTDVIAILQLMSLDKSNFYQISDCTIILTEMGRENVSILLQYLETLLLSTILKYHPELCQIVNQRNMNAPYGSKDDWNWRFQLMASHTELKALLPTQSEINRIKYYTYEMTSLDEKCFIPSLTVDQQLVASPINIVYSCSELNLIQNFVKDNSIRRFISPIITKYCPLLMASLNVDYVERRGLIAWSHAVNNLEYTLQQLTKIFQETLKDNTLQVIGASYTSICHCLSDSTVLTVDNVDYVSTVDRYYLEIDYPFWIFNNTIVLCSRFIQDIQGKATVAVSALTTLLHKRNHLLLDEAKNPISLGKHFGTDTTDNGSLFDETEQRKINCHPKTNHVKIDFVAEDQVYQARAQDLVIKLEQKQKQSEHQLKTLSNGLLFNTNQEHLAMPMIFDSTEQEHIGHCAEHFFYRYLEQLYGADITPTNN
ncbi:unnamed protein product [Didymodactylos carnosus]|uniref:Uncharacterized protein n=2 Tax=Didymodactylos carnosus TaxID=1234261 RepID=A0A815G8G9_9BILA|nr:unnamed protein product [Didymodactylos carnosus]CAF4193299.1 unnamed protein product [Didymodactylos carnosus]